MCRFSWFLDSGGWSQTTAVGLCFIFPGICTLSLESVMTVNYLMGNTSEYLSGVAIGGYRSYLDFATMMGCNLEL
ncbi:hypothetical protein STEG23_012427 [Scotinomys teguina]